MKNICLIASGIAMISVACNRDSVCTDDLRMITVEISGDTLDEYYTVRNSNQDTIRHGQNVSPADIGSILVVLTDSYRDQIKNTESEFIFVGLIDDSIRVWEPYIIGANECHIYHVNGPTQIQVQ